MDPQGNLLSSTRLPRTVNIEATKGAAGFAIYGGRPAEKERSAKLIGEERFRTYGRILADTPMVAAGVRYFLNLAANTEWKLVAADEESEEAKEKAVFVDKMLRRMETPMHRVIKQAAMHRFHGFATLEWTAAKKDDGIHVTHIENRSQWTVERWATDRAGRVHGIYQRAPQDGVEAFIPRQKMIYMVDNAFTDDPRGLGIMRHIVRAVEMLRDYERLEQIGFSTDMQGIPIARGPLAEIQANAQLSDDDKEALRAPLVEFIQNHIRGSDSGLVLDSQVFTGGGDDETPINARKFDVELLSGGSYGHKEIAAAIERMNREVARVLGVEQLLLGADSSGSLALSRDKSQAFFMVVNSALREIQVALTQDLITPLWTLNGFDPDIMPKLEFENVEFLDPEQISGMLKDIATSGVPILPEDPLVDEALRIVGLSGLNMKAREEQKALRISNAKLGLDENGLPLPGGGGFGQHQGGGGGSSGSKDPKDLSGNLKGVDPGGSADDKLRGSQGRQAAARRQPRPKNPSKTK